MNDVCLTKGYTLRCFMFAIRFEKGNKKLINTHILAYFREGGYDGSGVLNNSPYPKIKKINKYIL